VWVVAHRGASGYAPENTMAAFRRAVEMGARFIETDLHLTRDARVVAIHDSTLDRTTNGHGLRRSLAAQGSARTRCRRVVWIPRGPNLLQGSAFPLSMKSLRFARSATSSFTWR